MMMYDSVYPVFILFQVELGLWWCITIRSTHGIDKLSEQDLEEKQESLDITQNQTMDVLV